jgi:hypothetical protein
MIRFKIVRTGGGAILPGSADARKRACQCPIDENRSGAGWEVSSDRALRGFWIVEDCPMHRQLLEE